MSLSRCLATTALAFALPLASQAALAAAEQQVALRSATVGGLWCGAGLLAGFSLDIAQQYQRLQARLVRKNRVREITGRVEGSRVITDPHRDHTMELVALGNELRIVDATGKLALTKGLSFTRAVGGSCTH